MERVPTQTDLIRLCDAADDIVRYYKYDIHRTHGTVKGFTWQLDLFANIVRLLPYPRHYWTPFEIDFWESREFWNGWEDEAYDAFANLIFHARSIHWHWIGVTKAAQPNDRIQAIGGYAEEQIGYLKAYADLLRKKLTSPMRFNLLPDAKSLSLYRDEPEYKNKVARLGDWFSIVDAICNAGGFLSHESTEKAYRSAKFKGQYDNAFRKAVNTKLNPELYPLGVELTASRGEGWRIELFDQTLP